MTKLLSFILSTLLLIGVTSSCNTTGCTENQNSLPLAGFYSMTTKTSIEVDSISIGGVGVPNDSLLINNGKGISRVYLPFRTSKQSSTFFIHYEQKALSAPELNDTMTFDYTSSPIFVSEECGAMYFYRITRLTYTKHLIDSIGITDSLINNIDSERIKIYFRTTETDEPESGEDQPETTE